MIFSRQRAGPANRARTLSRSNEILAAPLEILAKTLAGAPAVSRSVGDICHPASGRGGGFRVGAAL